MAKRNFTKKEKILAIIQLLLIILIALIVVFSIPLGILFLIYKLLPKADVYLLTGLSVNIFLCIFTLIIPIVFFYLISEKKNRLKDLKIFFTKYKKLALIIISIIVFLETVFISGTIIYYKDVKIGPQESFMTDSVAIIRTGYKRNKDTYIDGYIGDEKVSFKITGSARKKVKKNKKYRLVKVYYYKNIKEVYDIDVFVSYE